MTAVFELLISGPHVVPTILLILVMVYWVIVIAGVTGFEMLDFDLDLDADESTFESMLGVGLIGLKFTNIGTMPIMIWLSVFVPSWLAVSLLTNNVANHDPLWLAGLIAFRNGAIALLPTKILTQPLRGRFDTVEPPSADELIGLTGIATTETSLNSGQAQIQADAAPLLLNVRTTQGIVAKGERVVIVDHDEARNTYIVEKATSKIVEVQ